MIIKEVSARIIKDSRKERTIEVSINNCVSSAPYGASRGKHEKKSYKISIEHDVSLINNIKIRKFKEINNFSDLEKIEKILKNKIGANSLFAFESSILKALAKENKKQVWQIIGQNRKPNKIELISNIIGGGAHTHKQKKEPDFQEFSVIGNFSHNKHIYEKIGKIIKSKSKNDEHAWNTELDNESILRILRNNFPNEKIGIDIAGSQLFKGQIYEYKNTKKLLSRKNQIIYVLYLINKYNLSYIEDPLEQEDFSGFSEILKNIEKQKRKCLITGDDLTTTNILRLKRAIENKSINAIIIKPNQIGSLIEVKKVIELAKKHNIKTIMSHRSGETSDNILADLAVGFSVDFMKISLSGRERLAKIERLGKIS